MNYAGARLAAEKLATFASLPRISKKGARSSAMKDFENVGRLSREKRFTKDQLLDAVDHGDIQLAAYAYGFFVWPARKTIGMHMEYYGQVRLCGEEYIFVSPRYTQRLVSSNRVAMGVARSSKDVDDDLHVRLEGNPKSKKKPSLSFKELFVDAESLAKLDGKDYQPDSPEHIVALQIRKDMLANHDDKPDHFPHPDICGEGKVYKYLALDNESSDYQISDDSRGVDNVAKKRGLGNLFVRYGDEANAVPFTKLMKAFQEFKGQ